MSNDLKLNSLNARKKTLYRHSYFSSHNLLQLQQSLQIFQYSKFSFTFSFMKSGEFNTPILKKLFPLVFSFLR